MKNVICTKIKVWRRNLMNENEVTYWANNSKEAIEIKESLLEKGVKVRHILTASTIPVLEYKEYYEVGACNIKNFVSDYYKK